jgi:tetratricopeptide (TPR) repeat protein
MGQASIPACPIFFMLRKIYSTFWFCTLLAPFSGAAFPQGAPAKPPAGTISPTQRGIDLAGKGRCRKALPLLKKSAPLTSDKEVKRKLELATVRCALSLDQADSAVQSLLWLNREFPSDPDVLYVTTHAYSDLSARASLRLVRTQPSSYQAHELNAEALESQGKWEDAAAEYRKIIELNPQLPGMHFRLGRLILSKPATPTTAADAKEEFEQELKLDPKNAGAEYVLGELAREAQSLDEAILHFSRATKADASFSDAFLSLGVAYLAVGKFSEAIGPLETYVKQEPRNPAGHYQLVLAYMRVGRREDAEREVELQKKTAALLEEEKSKNQESQQQPPPAGEAAPPAAPPQ